jgi:hypothetical protein
MLEGTSDRHEHRLITLFGGAAPMQQRRREPGGKCVLLSLCSDFLNDQRFIDI